MILSLVIFTSRCLIFGLAQCNQAAQSPGELRQLQSLRPAPPASVLSWLQAVAARGWTSGNTLCVVILETAVPEIRQKTSGFPAASTVLLEPRTDSGPAQRISYLARRLFAAPRPGSRRSESEQIGHVLCSASAAWLDT